MSSWKAGRVARGLRHGVALALSLTVLVGLLTSGADARQDERTKEIQEVEKKIDELKKQLASLKSPNPAKGSQRPLELKDVLAWKGISRVALSRDGVWFACAVTATEGGGELILKQTTGDKEQRFPIGGGVAGLSFSHDNRWLAFSSTPRGGKQGKRGPGGPGAATEESPAQGKVVLVNLAKNDKVEYEGVTRFSFAGEASTTLALYKSATPAAPTTPTQIPGGKTAATEAPTRSRGGDLILRDLAAGTELVLGNVSEYAFDKSGNWLALTIDTASQFGNGVQLRNMKTGVLTQLDSGKATYQGLTWTPKGEAFSLLKGVEDKKYRDKRCSVLAFRDLAAPSPTKLTYDPASDSAFPKDMVIATGRTPSFSEDLGTIFFGVREPRKADAPLAKGKGFPKKGGDPTKGGSPETTQAKSDKVDLVIWHGKDSRLQAQQQVEAGQDQNHNYLCAYRLKDKKFLRLADESLRTVNVAAKERYAVGLDRRPYELAGSLDGKRYQDVYVVDLQTGERSLALKQARYPMTVSPDGRKMLYYEDGHFHVYDFAEKTGRAITKTAPVSFINAEDDHNVDRPPTRSVGWAKDSSAVLLSDNWDVWKIPVGDGAPMNLTVNGKKDGIRYSQRVVFDVEEKGIDLDKPQYFQIYGEWTKKSGYVRIDPKGVLPTVLCWDDVAYSGLTKARDAEVYVHTRETIRDYPDYYVTDAGFQSPRRLTSVQTDQDKFLWSNGSMLVNYESAKGERLQGALFLPANYEKGKRYPTIVYIYEKLSQGKNRYMTPRASGGFNAALYTSNGYAVLMPDIRYTINDPGMSAVWCVLPALEAAISTGVVDRDRVGLQGHSWGGYQTAFLITQTPAFKAAVAGAPLTNLVSMYSSVYWNTGSANQPIFESSQGRFTGGYWEQQEAYLRNSPVFHAKNVKTPLMLLHNDKDGAGDFLKGPAKGRC